MNTFGGFGDALQIGEPRRDSFDCRNHRLIKFEFKLFSGDQQVETPTLGLHRATASSRLHGPAALRLHE